jgi:hypothetical protein
MGLHTIDTVRRDAAERQIWFETKHIQNDDKTEIVLTCDPVKLVYTVDMETDIVDKITISSDSGSAGELTFSYLQDGDITGQEFAPPRLRSNQSSRQSPPGMLWLVKLIDSHW